MVKWEQVTIVGCGLIGASFALALRERGVCQRIAGWDASPMVLDEACNRGVIDFVDNAFARGSTSTSDLIYLAMPVNGIIEFLKQHGSQVRPGAVITDAGSTKFEVCRAAQNYLPKDTSFIGGHPIAGSHQSGLAYAQADLFQGSAYVLVDESTTHRDALERVRETIQACGARTKMMSAAEHDQAMAFISHLPQLISSALAGTIKEQPHAELLFDLAGSGYRDMTRLAASSWGMWADILETNSAPIADALDMFIDKLMLVRDELRDVKQAADLARTRDLFR